MISQTTEYALRAAVWLAQNTGGPQTRLQISKATKVPWDYLAKVMRSLVLSNLVRAGRGRHGGFALARPAGRISILEVVNAVDPIRRIRSCPLGITSHSAELCPLHHRLDDALARIEDSFAATCLADLIGQPGHVQPLCERPAAIAGAPA